MVIPKSCRFVDSDIQAWEVPDLEDHEVPPHWAHELCLVAIRIFRGEEDK